MSQITVMLKEARKGSSPDANELLPLVYDELRRLAQSKIGSQPPGQTLQATALVHEAWLRICGPELQNWESRRHFFAAAAQAMRHILVERARKKQSRKHGGGLEAVNIDGIDIAAPASDDRALLIDAALEEFARIAPEKAEVVNLRFFVGLEEREIADLLGISPRTVERYWSYAKAWLYEKLSNS